MVKLNEKVVCGFIGFMRMKILLSRHAKRRMQERKILFGEILDVIERPDKIVPSIKGRLNFIKVLGGKRIKVTCKDNPGELIVVTVIEKKL